MRRKDKVEFPAGFTINNHLSVRGETLGKIVIFRDMTNVFKIQEEILRMDRLISLGKLSSGIAHELRNPLAGIKKLPKRSARKCPKRILGENT